jgi:hypothetical protein
VRRCRFWEGLPRLELSARAAFQPVAFVDGIDPRRAFALERVCATSIDRVIRRTPGRHRAILSQSIIR